MLLFVVLLCLFVSVPSSLTRLPSLLNLGSRRIVFCSGKVFYDLHAKREELGLDKGQLAIVRVEQLAPFPFDLVSRELRRYPNAEVVWCQEEPMNMGAYFHVQPRLISCLK